ncbi:hypothetical protein D3C77_396150 [compost metagenome]
MDRSLDKARRLVGQCNSYPRRQGFLDLRQQLTNAIDDDQGVTRRRGEKSQMHCRLAIHRCTGLGCGSIELDGAHITQAHKIGTVVADDQVAKFFGAGHIGIDTDVGKYVLPANLPRRGLVVIVAHGLSDICGRYPTPRHALAVQPQTHGQVLPAKGLHLGNTLDA